MTNYDKSSLSSSQLKALPSIIASRSVDEACKEAGISRNCYYEWMKTPEFREEVTRIREEILNEAIEHLKANTTKAVATLSALMDNEGSPAVQRSAANDVLNYVIKFREVQDFDKRLQEIEKSISNGGDA